jgi:hypothetical protein
LATAAAAEAARLPEHDTKHCGEVLDDPELYNAHCHELGSLRTNVCMTGQKDIQKLDGCDKPDNPLQPSEFQTQILFIAKVHFESVHSIRRVLPTSLFIRHHVGIKEEATPRRWRGCSSKKAGVDEHEWEPGGQRLEC